MPNTLSEYFAINRVVRETAYRMNNTHSHECYEIIYLISGECNILLNHSIYVMKPGNLVIIPPGEIHKSSYGSNEKVKQERAIIRFGIADFDWSRQMIDEEIFKENLIDDMIAVPDKRRGYIENLIDRIIFERNQADEMSEAAAKTLFQELIIFIIRCRKYGEGVERELSAENKIIQQVATYIYENYDKPIYLDSIAGRFNISRSYLSKKFKEVTGFGFKEYLLNVRIKKACSLLLESNQSITDIAFACGFNDSNYFGDAFRRMKGISPNKYRRNGEMV